MSADILPSLAEIHDRMTRNERERRELAALERLHLQRRRWAERDRQQQAPRGREATACST